MKKIKLITALIPLAFVALSGCASIISHSSYPVRIASQPEQADFTVTNQAGLEVHSGKTPATVQLKSSAGYFAGERYRVSYQKDGYIPQTSTLDSGINGWYFGNLAFGGLLGLLIIDPATGAMFDLPEELAASLAPQSHQAAPLPPTGTITTPIKPIATPPPFKSYVVPVKSVAPPQKPLYVAPVATPASEPVPPQSLHSGGRDLRYCLELSSDEAIARCAEKNR